MTILLIDDLRDFRFAPDEKLVIARTSKEALDYLAAHKEDEFTSVWFDHDLGELADGTVDSTMPVLDYLSYLAFTDEPLKVDTVYVHTSNPVGARQLMTSLARYGYNVKRVNASEIFGVN